MLNSKFKFPKFKHFLSNEQGSAAIEFIFIAPVMIATYFGLAEVSLLISADRDVSHATSVAADLSTQVETLGPNDIEDIFNATLAVMSVTDTQANRLTIDVISYEKDNNGTLTEIGYAKLGSGLSTKYVPPGTISNALLNATSGLVITRIEYKYETPTGLGYYVKSPTLSETFMLKPRKSATIPFSTASISCNLVTGGANGPRANC